MSEKLLIIDDFEPVRKTVRRIAEREHFITIQASEGREGLYVFEREHPDIVITDLKMPLIDGKGVLCAIKQQSPETEVIVLTGYGDAETASSLIKLGAFSYLQKPLDLQQLVKVLEQARLSVRKRTGNSACVPAQSVPLQIEMSGKKMVSVRWGQDNNAAARDALQLFAEEVPFPLLVLNSHLDVLYSNGALKQGAPGVGHRFDEALINNMRQGGVSMPPFAELESNLRTVLQNIDPVLQTARVNDYLNLGIYKARVSAGTSPASDVLVLMFPMLGTLPLHR